MVKIHVVAFAKIVQTLLSVPCADKTVLGALTMTGKLEIALTALSRKCCFQLAETVLLLTVAESSDGLVVDIT